MKKALSIKRLVKSFGYAFEGFKMVFLDEPNMRIHTLMATLVIILGFLLKCTNVEWIFLVFAIGMVMGAETINTCIENLVDLVTSEYNVKAKNAKDTAAAFVMILSITAAIIGLIIFIPKIIDFIGGF